MNVVQVTLLAILVLAGCSRQKPSGGATTFKVWDESWSNHAAYRLLPAGEKLLESVLAQKPDTDFRASIGLDPSGILVLDSHKYAIEPDMIVLLSNNRTKIWNRKGIREDLIENSITLK